MKSLQQVQPVKQTVVVGPYDSADSKLLVMSVADRDILYGAFDKPI